MRTGSSTISSKLRKRAPEALQANLNAVFEGDASVRIPAEDFVNYFHGKNLDPAAVAHQVGVSNLEEAAAAGSDLEIPKANFFGKLDPEDQKGLLPDAIDPKMGMTARQAETAKQELQNWIDNGGAAKLQAEYEQADAETQSTPEWKSVYSDLKQRYLDAGEKENAANGYATLQANAIANLAKQAGMKPDELLALHNPRIVAGEAPEEDREHASVLQQGGNFGPVHEEFYHDAQGAIAKLLEEKEGEATAAASHPSVGDFDLLYGKEGTPEKDYEDGYGVAKLAAKHPEVLNDFQGFIDGLHEISRSKNRVRLADDSGLAVLRLSRENANRPWLLTAFKKDGDLSAAEGRRTGVANGAESVPPTDQEADNKSSVASSEPEGNRVLHQASAAEQPRGWFRMTRNGYEIGKTKIGDMSTLIHEPAHAYLELFRELSGREKASAAIKDDFKKITEWLGTTPEEARANGFTREQHEQWARANEKYVREGVAPSSDLRRAFHNFAVWLGNIYQRATDLHVDVSPEVRGVMDRLYAREGAVEHAERQAGEPLFKTPEEAGWTDEQFRNYADAHGIAVDKAREQVAAEMNAGVERERTEQFREEKGNVRDAVTEQIDAYTAIRSLRRGKLEQIGLHAKSPLSLIIWGRPADCVRRGSNAYH